MSAVDADSLDDVFDVQELAFGYRAGKARREADRKLIDPARVIASRDRGAIVGVAEWMPARMTLPGRAVEPVAAVSGVAVRPTHRRQGRLRAMMRRQLDALNAGAQHSAVLVASEPMIYQRFGYGPATLGSRYTVEKRGLQVETRSKSTGRIELVSADEARRTFPGLLERAQAERAGEVFRWDFQWDYLLGRYDDGTKSEPYFVRYVDGEVLGGYGIYRIEADPAGGFDRTIRLVELCAPTPAAYLGLWSYLVSIDLVPKIETGWRPVDEPIRWALSDYRAMRCERTCERTFVRLIDVAEALARRRYQPKGSLVLAVRDPFCPWNEGGYRIEAGEEGEAAISRTGVAGSDLALDVSTLGSLYLGGLSASVLARAGLVEELSLGALEKADRLFGVSAPPFCSVSF